MQNAEIQAWVERFQLVKHPEGGYYAETYRSTGQIPASVLPEFDGPRLYSTAIYYLLPGDTFSAFHRIRSDELWHFYAGSAMTLYLLKEGEEGRQIQVGPGNFQALAPAGWWFAGHVNDPAAYALIGCTVAPGFDYADFELADRAELLRKFPGYESWIISLTHKE